MSKKNYTPNDQRSIVKNHNNPAYADDRANRIALGHPSPPAPPEQPQPEPKK